MTIASIYERAIEPLSGTYLLIMQSEARQQIEVGRLGLMQLDVGYYLYVGSAFGPGGVRARAKHHMAISARPRWHIDYLRRVCELKAVWCCYDEVHREHQWVTLLESQPGLTIGMAGFGASDHPGKSHLFYCYDEPSFVAFSRRARKQKEELKAPLHRILISA